MAERSTNSAKGHGVQRGSVGTAATALPTSNLCLMQKSINNLRRSFKVEKRNKCAQNLLHMSTLMGCGFASGLRCLSLRGENRASSDWHFHIHEGRVLEGGWVVGGMITFFALAHMVDATSCTLVVALAHMVDATSLTLIVALAHMVDATSLTLIVALAHIVDATSLT